MTNTKLLKLAALALVSATALSAQLAFAGGASCSDWSYNDSSCSAYLNPSEKKAAANVTAAADGASCSDWSFNNAGCSAYLKPSEKKAEAVVASANGNAFCADWSFNDAGCSASVRR